MRYVQQPGGPTVVTLEKHVLGTKLAELRESRGMSLAEAAERWGWNKNKVDLWEKGIWKRAKVHDLVMLLAVYGLRSETETAPYVNLLRAASAPEWFAHQARALDGAFPSLEGRAQETLAFSPVAIPGLLQSPEYARSLRRMVLQPPEELQAAWTEQDIIDFRLERQKKVFAGRPQAPVTLVVGEDAVRRGQAMPDVWPEQARHIRDLVEEHPQLHVHVLPVKAVATHTGHFIVWDFKEPWEIGIAYSEAGILAQYVDDPERVTYLRQAFLRLLGESLGPEESINMIMEGTEG